MNNKPYIEIKPINHIPGKSWKASLKSGGGSVGYYGNSAREAEKALRENVDCEGVEAAEYIDRNTPTDENGMLTDKLIRGAVGLALAASLASFFLATLLCEGKPVRFQRPAVVGVR